MVKQTFTIWAAAVLVKFVVKINGVEMFDIFIKSGYSFLNILQPIIFNYRVLIIVDSFSSNMFFTQINIPKFQVFEFELSLSVLFLNKNRKENTHCTCNDFQKQVQLGTMSSLCCLYGTHYNI